MQEEARVVSLNGTIAEVVPLNVEVCIGCSDKSCQQNGSVFRVVNLLNLDIRPGSLVRISARKGTQVVQALVSAGLPLGAMVAGYLLAPMAWPGAGDGLRVGVGLLSMTAAFVLIYFWSKAFRPELPFISGLLT